MRGHVAGGDALRAGAAEARLPAGPGLDLAGFVARENPCRGVHDEIHARALALQAGDLLMLIIAVDVLGFEASVVEAVRGEIGRKLSERGFSGRPAVTIAATHTHSAPASMPLRNCGAVDPAWLRQTREILVDVALSAVRHLRPARLGVGRGGVHGVAGNRRSPNFPHEPGAPVDPELGLLRIEKTDGGPLACLVNFTCHPVILGPEQREVSGDYPGRVAALLSERLGGGEPVVLFTNGASGDVNPIWRGSWEDVEYLAERVAAEAVRVWRETPLSETVTLAASSSVLSLPLLPLPSAEDLEAAARRFADEEAVAGRAGQGTAARVAGAFREWAEDARRFGDAPPPIDLEVQVLRVGDAVLVAVPGELFVALGGEIKRGLADRGIGPCWILGYANGNIGYLPTRPAYAQGGYEVDTAHRFYRQPACVAPEAGEAVVGCAVELAMAACRPAGTGE